MNNYTEISELDDKANQLRVLWRKTINFAASFAREFQELEARFATGVYGPEWTFSRWLVAKCGLSRSTSYRVIQTLHLLATEDQKEQIREAIERERKEKAVIAAERKATQLAWDGWRREELERIAMTQIAWDQWRGEEKAMKITEQQRSANAEYQARHRAKRKEILRKAGNGSTRLKSETDDLESELLELLRRLEDILMALSCDRRMVIVDAIGEVLRRVKVRSAIDPVAIH